VAGAIIAFFLATDIEWKSIKVKPPAPSDAESGTASPEKESAAAAAPPEEHAHKEQVSR